MHICDSIEQYEVHTNKVCKEDALRSFELPPPLDGTDSLILGIDNYKYIVRNNTPCLEDS